MGVELKELKLLRREIAQDFSDLVRNLQAVNVERLFFYDLI